MARVSVIVPIYNVEKYLKKCLDSICNQTLQDIEIICVNDGSTDNCLEICEMYANNDKRIKVINKINSGLSAARNTGLKVASGEFIYFIDSDDYISLNMLSTLVHIMEKNDCDIVISGYQTTPNNSKCIPLYKLNEVLDPISLISNNTNVHSHNDLCFVWRYFFRHSLLKENNIKFNEEIRIGEDFIFNLVCLASCTRVYVTDYSGYYYTTNNYTSIMRLPYKENLETNLINQYNEKKRLSLEFGLYQIESYRKNMAEYYVNNMLPMVFRNIFNGPEKDKNLAIKRVLNYQMFRESFKEIGFSYETTNYKEYIAYLILKFRIYSLAYRIINKQYKIN